MENYRIRRRQRAVRSYVVALKPNRDKAEDSRYAIWWATRWALNYVHALYVMPPNARTSTVGLGALNNDAQKIARDIIRVGRAAERATRRRFGRPETVPTCATANIRPAHGTSFLYWAQIPTCAPVPLVPHRALSRALRFGGKVTSQCQVRIGKRGGIVALVRVEMPKPQASPSRDFIGADVGVNVAVATSDGRCAISLRPLLAHATAKRAEQQRQGHRRSSARTAVKQLLDREARRLVTLAKHGTKSIAIEGQWALANLRPTGKIGQWARRHFGERVRQLSEIQGVRIVEVNPAYTSQACRKCGFTAKTNRQGVFFACGQCGHRDHADVNAARNIAALARRVLRAERKGDVKHDHPAGSPLWLNP